MAPDAATPTTRRMTTSALAGLLAAAGVVALGAATATKLEVVGPPRFAAVAIAAFAAWTLVADSVRKLRECRDPRCHVRAGPEGISIRHPVGRTALGFGYRLLELEIPWGDVRRVFPVKARHNGFFFHDDLFIEYEGGWIHLEGRMFAEDPHVIAARLLSQRPRDAR